MAELKMKATLDASGVKDGASKAKRSIKGLGSSIKVALGIGIAKGVSGIVGLLKQIVVESIKVHARFERIGLTMNKLIGSPRVGKRLMAELREFSVKTPFTPEEVFKSSRLLMSFGFVAKDQIKTLKMLGDVASVSGKPLDELAFIYGKVFSRGRAQAREMNQMIRAQIPITREVAKVMGVAESQVAKLTEEGKVSFEVIKKALENLTGKGGQFFNMTEDSAKTLEGRWSTLKGAIADAGAALAQLVSPEIKSGLELLIKAAEAVGESLQGADIMLRGDKPDEFEDAVMRGMRRDLARLRALREGVDPGSDPSDEERRIQRALQRKSELSAARRREAQEIDKAINMAKSAPKGGVSDAEMQKMNLGSFFQQGQFMFNPSNIPMLNTQERQLLVLESIDSKIVSGNDPVDIMWNSVAKTFNTIKSGVAN